VRVSIGYVARSNDRRIRSLSKYLSKYILTRHHPLKAYLSRTISQQGMEPQFRFFSIF
jgi:hypothetical protein